MNALYHKFFGISQDDLKCENCGNSYKINVVLIDPEKDIIPRNMIALCRGCIEAVTEGEINKADLKYMHIVWMNRRDKMIKITK